MNKGEREGMEGEEGRREGGSDRGMGGGGREGRRDGEREGGKEGRRMGTRAKRLCSQAAIFTTWDYHSKLSIFVD